MNSLREGMTPADFLNAVNYNFEVLAVIREVSLYPAILSSDNYVDIINTNYGDNIVHGGMSGRAFADAIKFPDINEIDVFATDLLLDSTSDPVMAFGGKYIYVVI